MSQGAERGGSPETGLVLTGGGARAAYQVGILHYLGRRLDRSPFDILTGVSAGAINTGFLASTAEPFREATADLRSLWAALDTSEVMRSDPISLFGIVVRWLLTFASGGLGSAARARSLVDNRPLRIYLRDFVDPDRIAAKVDEGRLRAAAVSATSYGTGRTVTFVQGAPDVEMWKRPQREARRERITLDHVMASAAIPLLFPAVSLGDGWYGDGSIRQTTPLAPAIHLGARRVFAISSRYPRDLDEAQKPAVSGYPPVAQMAGVLANSIFLDTLEMDAAWVRRVNRLVSEIPEEKRAREPLQEVDLLVLRPSVDLGRLSREFEANLPITLRYLSRGLGTQESESPDLVSYLLFEQRYLRRLIQVGEEDAEREWPRIARFLGVEEEGGGEEETADEAAARVDA